MNTPTPEQIQPILKIVGRGLQKRRPENEMIAALTQLGISTTDAPKIFELVREQMRAGVQAALLGQEIQHPAEGFPNPLAEAAYREGYSAYRKVSQGMKIERILFLIVALVIVIILLAQVLKF